jgi:hypothetical protein
VVGRAGSAHKLLLLGTPGESVAVQACAGEARAHCVAACTLQRVLRAAASWDAHSSAGHAAMGPRGRALRVPVMAIGAGWRSACRALLTAPERALPRPPRS